MPSYNNPPWVFPSRPAVLRALCGFPFRPQLNRTGSVPCDLLRSSRWWWLEGSPGKRQGDVGPSGAMPGTGPMEAAKSTAKGTRSGSPGLLIRGACETLDNGHPFAPARITTNTSVLFTKCGRRSDSRPSIRPIVNTAPTKSIAASLPRAKRRGKPVIFSSRPKPHTPPGFR